MHTQTITLTFTKGESEESGGGGGVEGGANSDRGQTLESEELRGEPGKTGGERLG